MTRQQAIEQFKFGLEFRRLIFSTLFDAVQESRQFVDSNAGASAAKTAANFVAQDTSNGLMLITDYVVVRCLVDGGVLPPDHRRSDLHIALQKIGPRVNTSVRFAEVIAVFADMARHFHEWQSTGKISADNERVLLAIGMDKRHDQAAAHFLADQSRFAEYDDFERALNQIADDIAGV